MPNYCNNTLKIYGDDSFVDQFIQSFKAEGYECCAPIPPMPKNDLMDWAYDNWGCKWNVPSDEIYDGSTEKEKKLYFRSPWSPPRVFVYKASKQYPQLNFRLEYSEFGMNFCGIFEMKNGEVLRDDQDSYVSILGAEVLGTDMLKQEIDILLMSRDEKDFLSRLSDFGCTDKSIDSREAFISRGLDKYDRWELVSIYHQVLDLKWAED